MIRIETILDELKKSVFGQDEYLKQLAITGYKHQLKTELLKKGKDPVDTNLLVIGPSGCGKTFAVRRLAELLEIPFYEINCANLTEVGYRGTQDIEIALGGMVHTLKSNCEHAIVYLDEFDKILDFNQLKDGNGKAVQQNFLKIIEPNTITVPYSNLSKNATNIDIDTSGITFIATGTFDIAKNKKKKDNGSKMGFNSANSKEKYTVLDEEDLIRCGYMPELIGRFSTIININQLTKNDLYNIIKKGNKSALKNYELMLEDQGVELKINDKVYREIANIAYNGITGARGINKILNEILDDGLCKISNDSSISKITIQYSDNQFKTDYERDLKKKKEYMDKTVTVDKLIAIDDVLQYVCHNASIKATKVKLFRQVKTYFEQVFYGIGCKDIKLHDLLLIVENNKENIDSNLALLNNNRSPEDVIDNEEQTVYLSLVLDVYKDLLNKISLEKHIDWKVH